MVSRVGIKILEGPKLTGKPTTLLRAEQEMQTIRQNLKQLPVPTKANFKMEKLAKNMQLIDVDFEGRPGSVYEGCHIKGTMILHDDYPDKPPIYKFATVDSKNFQHLNVYGNGDTCIDILNPEAYTPSTTLIQILIALEKLIYEPNEDSPANLKLTELYKKDKAAYEEEIKAQAAILKSLSVKK